MGRYVYDSGLVTQAIDKLNDAIKSLSDVTTEIQAGVNTINGARGSNCIDVDYTKILQLQATAEEVIEEDIRTIQSKVTIIEDYENAPWYKKLFSSIGMGLTKFVEGIASGIENLGDGVVSIVGFVGGIFNSEFKNSCAEYVAKDHVGDWCAKQYESGFLSDMNKYSTFSHESTWANVFKGFGTAAPYIALSMTGVGLVTETAVAAVSGIGSGTEAGIQKALANDPNMRAGDAFNSAFAQGLWQGTKNAALVYGMGKLAKGIQARNGQFVQGSADDFLKLTTGTADDVAKTAQKMIGSADDLTAIPLDDGYRLVKSSADGLGKDVGRLIFNGDNVILSSFDDVAGAAKNFNAATRVLSKSGDEILYNTAGKITPGLEAAGSSGLKLSELAGKSFDDIAAGTTIGKSGTIFKKAGKFEGTKAGQVLNASDDALTTVGSKVANSKVGQGVSKLTGKVTDSKFVQKAVNGIKNSKLAGAATQFVTKHPVATYGAAATVFTADQIDEDVINSQYRVAQNAGDVAVREDPSIAPPNLDSSATADPNGGGNNGGGNNGGGNNGGGNNSGGNNGGGNNGGGNNGGGNNGGGNNGGGNNGGGNNGGGNNGGGNNDGGNNGGGNNDGGNNGGGNNDGGNNGGGNNGGGNNGGGNNGGGNNGGGNNGGGNNGGGNNGGGNYGGGNSGSQFGGGEFSDEGYKGEDDVELPGGESVSGSFTDIIGGNEYTNIPTSAAPITTTTTEGGKKSIIPVIAGLSAAAVAGIGTKAYLDKKENSSEEEFNAEEWEEQDELDIDYNEAMEEDGDYLNPSDEYAYQDGDGDDQPTYEAVNSSELASMQ